MMQSLTATGEEKRKVGRPWRWKFYVDLERDCDRYFAEHEGKPVSLSGLCLHLKTTPDVLSDYEKRGDGYSKAIKIARLRVTKWYEEQFSNPRIPPAKWIFAMCNMGWKQPESQGNRIEHQSNLTVHGVVVLPPLHVQEQKKIRMIKNLPTEKNQEDSNGKE